MGLNTTPPRIKGHKITVENSLFQIKYAMYVPN